MYQDFASNAGNENGRNIFSVNVCCKNQCSDKLIEAKIEKTFIYINYLFSPFIYAGECYFQ